MTFYGNYGIFLIMGNAGFLSSTLVTSIMGAGAALRCRAQEDVAGVTLLALGNGMPDVMTACSSINKAEFPLWVLEVKGLGS